MEQQPGSKLGKEYGMAVLPVLLFNLYAEYSMRNAGLDESQAWIKIAGRNIKNLRYADDTTVMGESEEELKGLLMSVKEESEKTGLKLNIQKSKIMASGPITLWQIEGEKVQVVTDFIFLGSRIPMDGDWSHEIKRCLLLGRRYDKQAGGLNHFSIVSGSASLWTVALQAPLLMRFPRQEYWNGLPCPPPGELPDSGIEPTSLMSPTFTGGFLNTCAPWEA